MLERFTAEAKLAYQIAGEFAASRQREADNLTADEPVSDVRIGVHDLAMACEMCTNSAWSGTQTLRLDCQLAYLPDGPIGVRELREALEYTPPPLKSISGMRPRPLLVPAFAWRLWETKRHLLYPRYWRDR